MDYPAVIECSSSQIEYKGITLTPSYLRTGLKSNNPGFNPIRNCQFVIVLIPDQRKSALNNSTKNLFSMNSIPILGGRIGNERGAKAHIYKPLSHVRPNLFNALLFPAKFTNHHMQTIHKSRLKGFDRAHFLQASRECLLSRVTSNIPKFGFLSVRFQQHGILDFYLSNAYPYRQITIPPF